jgi:hypothetical protein
MGWTGHVPNVGEMGNICIILVRKSEVKRQFGRLGIDERIILKWITLLELIWLRLETSVGLL